MGFIQNRGGDQRNRKSSSADVRPRSRKLSSHSRVTLALASTLLATCGLPSLAGGLTAMANTTLPSTDAPPVANGVVQVSTASQLEYMDQNPSSYLSSNIDLMNSIDLSGYNWTPLGASSSAFTGTFNGEGNEVTGLSISGSGTMGFIDAVDGTGTIESLGVQAAVQSTGGTRPHVGILVGYMNGGTITDSYATGSATGTSEVGGLVGNLSDGSITDSYATVSVTGDIAGGLVGAMNGGSIATSYATGSVTGNSDLGGLAGDLKGGTITDSYATGSVSGGVHSDGGLVGYQDTRFSGGSGITDSYATGAATGATGASGGLVGWDYVGTNTGDYWFAGNEPADFFEGGSYGTKLTATQMTQQASFVGWDFTTPSAAWAIDSSGKVNNGYPYWAAIVTSSLPSATQGSGYQFQITRFDRNGVTSWSATGLPPGITIDPSTGVLSGTPTTHGNYSVTVDMTDTAGNTRSASFPFHVIGNAPTLGTPPTASPGTLVGTTTVMATPNTSGDTLVYQVSTSKITTPLMDSAPPSGSGVFTSGTNLTGSAGDTVGVYEVNGSGQVVAFNSITLTSSNVAVDAPTLGTTPTASPGTSVGTTTVMATPNTSVDTLVYQVSTSKIAAPLLNSAPPSGSGVFSSGSNLTASAGDTVGVYEVNSSKQVVAFSSITVSSGDIEGNAPTLGTTPTASPGAFVGTTTVVARPNTSVDTLVYQVSTSEIAAPPLNSAPPSGSGVFTSGTNLTASAGDTVGVYEVNSSKQVVAFSLITVFSSEIDGYAPLLDTPPTASPGTMVGTITVMATPNTSWDTLVYKLSTSKIPTPGLNSAPPSGSGVFSSASNLTARAGDTVGVYDVNLSGQVVAFSLITVSSGDIDGYAPALGTPPTASPGAFAGSTTVMATPNASGDTLMYQVSTSKIPVPSMHGAPPSGSGAFISGANLTASAGDTVGVYEVNSSNQVVAFGSITLTSSDFPTDAPPALLPSTDAPPVASGVVQVSTASQLEYMDQNQSSYLSSNIDLMNNMDLSGYYWTPFGASGSPFTGTFSGEGHQVTGLSISGSGTIGFIGELSGAGTIENLGVKAPVRSTGGTGKSEVGILVGLVNSGGTITDSYATGSVTGNGDLGGLVGFMNGDTINNSYATASVAGGSTNGGGGLVGEMAGGSIAVSYATGSVTGSGNGDLGGLVGLMDGGVINNSYATGAVTGGGNSDGGLVGYEDIGSLAPVSGGSGMTEINDSYATGAATGAVGGANGGLVGWIYHGTNEGNYYFSGNATTGVGLGIMSGVTGLTATQMTQQASFAGWDFTTPSAAWAIDSSGTVNSGYPYWAAILTSSLPSATQGSKYQFTMTAFDRAGVKSWSATGLPTGLTLDPSTGVLSGTPTTLGNYTVNVKMTDKAGNTRSASFPFHFNAPTLGTTPTASPGTLVGTTTVMATPNTSGDTLVYQVSTSKIATPLWDSAPPSGSGVFSSGANLTASAGDTVGVYEVNRSDQVVAFSLITVLSGDIDGNAPVLDTPPTVSPGMLAGTTNVMATPNTSGDTLVYQVSTSKIATPLMDSAPPSGPDVFGLGVALTVSVGDTVGVYEVNSSEQVVAFSLITVSSGDIPGNAPTLGTPPTASPGALVGTTTVVATPNTSGDTLLYIVSTSKSPTPLLNSAPPIGPGFFGHYTSGTNLKASAGDTVDVYEINSFDQVVAFGSITLTSSDVNGASGTSGGSTSGGSTSGGSTTPSIPTTSVSPGTVGKSFTQTLSATGGSSPYTWSVTSGTLPAGLSLDDATGVISGTLKKAGASDVTVKVTDSNGQTASETLTVDVLQPDEREIVWNGKIQNVPAIVGNYGGKQTTYMPIWYVMQFLKSMGIDSTWNGHDWNMSTSTMPVVSDIHAGAGSTSIYMNGTLVQRVNTEAQVDPSTNKLTTYMPIWYVEQILDRVGLISAWNGTTWTVTK